METAEQTPASFPTEVRLHGDRKEAALSSTKLNSWKPQPDNIQHKLKVIMNKNKNVQLMWSYVLNSNIASLKHVFYVPTRQKQVIG